MNLILDNISEKFCMKKISSFIIIFFISFSILIADTTSKNLLSISLQNASYQELNSIARAWEIPLEEDEDILRNKIIKYFNINTDETIVEEQKAEENEYNLKIINAENFSSEENYIILSGDVSIEFLPKNEKTGNNLSADKILIDLSQSILIAMGNVSYNKDKVMKGDSIVIDWKNSKINVSGGMLSISRENKDNKKISFFAKGKTISYINQIGLIGMSDSNISTIEKNPLWSIHAKEIFVMESGDMFLKNATVKLGRVGLLWFPIFFYPGTKMVFNPAIGFASNRGMFLNTTSELYGTYPTKGRESEESSFSSLLKSEEEQDMIRDGFFYRPKKETEELTSIENWAQKTKSYFALFGDVYEKGGLFLGYDTVNKIKEGFDINSSGGFGFEKDLYRYFFELSLDYKIDNLALSLLFPIYSEPNAKYFYSSRNIGLAFDSLLGAEQQFPQGVSSRDEYKWKFSLNGNISIFDPYISTFKINDLDSSINFKYDYDAKKYIMDTSNYVNGDIELGGTLFSITGDLNNKNYTNSLAQEFSSQIQQNEENSINLTDVYLGSSIPYNLVNEQYNLSFSYSINQYIDFNNEKGIDLFSSKTNSNLNLNGNLGNWFSLKQSFNPELIYSEEDNGEKTFRISSNTGLAIEKLGLSYTINQRIYDDTFFGIYEEGKVYEHKISFNQDVSIFNFSVDLKLPPLDKSIIPKISFDYGGLTGYTSLRFKEDENDILKKNILNSKIGYKGHGFEFSTSFSFDTALPFKDTFKGTQLFSWGDTDIIKISQGSAFSEEFIFDTFYLSASHKANLIKLNLKDEDFKLDSLDLTLGITNKTYQFYKNRAKIRFNLTGNFHYDFENPYGTNLFINGGIDFAIAEFIDLSFSFSTSNTGFFRYIDGNGKISFKYLWEDLLRSFDFFGDGRNNTMFNLSKLEFELIHDLQDWDFHCKYSGSVVYSNKQWCWTPVFTVYVQWKAIPELKTEYVKGE